ncbi:hypothetical protein J4401_07410 [Candidatus Woesearchaeota archaeon]|nr:hypothetical protein [Candidatus Woesearchaeota archaeon]
MIQEDVFEPWKDYVNEKTRRRQHWPSQKDESMYLDNEFIDVGENGYLYVQTYY